MKKIILILFMSLFLSISAYAGWNGIVDAQDNRLKIETNGSMPVTLQDSTEPIFIIPMSTEAGTPTTLTAQAVRGVYDLTVADTTGFVAGTFITMINTAGIRYWYGYQIGAPIGSVLHLDRPLDSTFEIGDVVNPASTSMVVNGLVTPKIFRIRLGDPSPGLPVTIDITRIIVTIYTDTAVSLADFGDITGGLTHGCLMRRVDGVYQNIFNIKSNGELAGISFDINFYQSTNPTQGTDGLTSRLTFAGQNKMGAVVRIGPDEDLQFIIQDDLSSLLFMQVIAEGSVVVE